MEALLENPETDSAKISSDWPMVFNIDRKRAATQPNILVASMHLQFPGINYTEEQTDHLVFEPIQ